MAERTRFLGFDEAVVQRVQKSCRVEPVDTRPPVVDLEDVLAVPGYDALYDLQGRRIEVTMRTYIPQELRAPHLVERLTRNDDRYSPPVIVPPAVEEVVEDTVAYGGVVWPHYGHFLTDAMARFWFLESADPAWPVVYLNRPDPKYLATGYIGLTLGALGFGQSRHIFTVSKPTLFRRMVAPVPSIQGAFKLYHCHQFPHMQVTEALLPRASDEFKGRPVYLSRSGLRAGLRQSPEEGELEQRLRREGYAIVHPEALSFIEQIALFNSSPMIAGTIGSAFHTALFSRPTFQGQLFMLTWGKPNTRYLMIDQIKNCRSSYLNCTTISSVQANERVESINVDVDLAMDMLAQAGGLPGAARF